MTYIFCRNGHIHDIEFQADQSGKDPVTGERRPDIVPLSWGDYYIRNADGVDLRIGCNNITIENISGFTQDDTVALTALTGFEKNVFVEEKPTDICRVFIKNIVSNSANCANIRLTCGDGNKIHDIFIDGMIDTSVGKPYRASAAIRIDNHRYGKTKKAAHGDMCNVSINNISTRAKAAVEVVGTIKNLSVQNIMLSEPDSCAISNFNIPSKLENVSLRAVYNSAENCNPAAIKLTDSEAINITTSDIFLA